MPGPGCGARRASGAGLAAILCVLVGVDGVAADGVAADGRTTERLYTVRPGDSLWTIADRYLLSPGHWLALGRHDHLDRPDDLTPGTLLEIPIAWLQRRPAPAELVAVGGAGGLAIETPVASAAARGVTRRGGGRGRVGGAPGAARPAAALCRARASSGPALARLALRLAAAAGAERAGREPQMDRRRRPPRRPGPGVAPDRPPGAGRVAREGGRRAR